jgi:hypothetical protein
MRNYIPKKKMKPPIPVKCDNETCGRVWEYKSKYRKWYASCPTCRKKVRIRELVLKRDGDL